ncbi:MAG TPA: hypothetical protein VF993_15350 [Myxococcales bacterium]|jgi:hypothetical protein
MDKLIAVVDLTSGAVLNRDKETLTLDIPPDFDRHTGGVFVDADKLGRYRTAEGQTCVYATTPSHLSQRSAGEECLVATQEVDSSGASCTRRYWLAVVEPKR